MTAYNLLRKSESLQIQSNRDQKKEVITLLSHFGYALFQGIIPKKISNTIYDEGGIFIFAYHQEILDLPWELLFDGQSFLALSQSLVRIHESGSRNFIEKGDSPPERLNIHLHSFLPLSVFQNSMSEPFGLGNRFISYVEEIATGKIENAKNIAFRIDSNSTSDSVQKSLSENPHIFFFSGYETKDGWILENFLEQRDTQPLQNFQRQTKIKDAVGRGLRILILSTSKFLDEKWTHQNEYFKNFFDLGVPIIISISGRLERSRIQLYLQNFFIALSKNENILKAHRLAINSLQSSLPLSWDWSWILFRVNKNHLDSTRFSPLESFGLSGKTTLPDMNSPQVPHHILSYHPFSGNAQVLRDISHQILTMPEDSVLSLQSERGVDLEEYLREHFRRLHSCMSFQVETIYYLSSNTQVPPDKANEFAELRKTFAFIFSSDEVRKFYDHSTLVLNQVENPAMKFLVVYHYQKIRNPLFEEWITLKRAQGKQIIFLSPQQNSIPKIPHKTVNTDTLSLMDICNYFEDEFPETWSPLLTDPPPNQLTNLGLLKIAQQLGDQKFLESFVKQENLSILFDELFLKILSSISKKALRLFLSCFYLKIKISFDNLSGYYPSGPIEKDLEVLVKLGLIESDLCQDRFWVPLYLQFWFNPAKHLTKIQLIEFLKDFLQKQLVYLTRHKNQQIEPICGFYYCATALKNLGAEESAILRNLQLADSLDHKTERSYSFHYKLITTCLRWALASKNEKLYPKTLLRVMSILENLSFEKQVIRLYEWLIKQEQHSKNWKAVSELQMKVAGLYAKINEPEKALNLLTSTIYLCNDIKQFNYKTQNQINIALLFLDMEEYEKAKDVINGSNFQTDQLNEENTAKLWLIDGHLLFVERKYPEALNAFSKSWEKTQNTISPRLLAKTYYSMSLINKEYRNIKQQTECLVKAASLFEKAKLPKKASELHESLYELFIEQDKNDNAINHLEWLFRFFEQEKDFKGQKKIANLLGVLYFKVGLQQKSTEFYKIAQGIDQ